ncbi:TonB-dependent siderophore receptor [Nitrospira sp. KM1]|nr:TonB-dependent siderophore receptor [Nitrospira sp. KM1]
MRWPAIWGFTVLMMIWIAAAFAEPLSDQSPRSFEIPPQSLSSALLQFSEATNQELMVDASLTQGLQSQGVSGEHTPAAALSAILAGTGLTYLLTGSGAMTVIKAPVPAATPGSPSSELPGDTSRAANQKPVKVPEILVKDVRARDDYSTYAPSESTTGTKTETPITEVPQSISIITRKEMDARAVTSVADAVRYTPGVQAEGFGFDSRGFDWFFMRGFDALATNDYRDGLRQVGRNFTFFRTEAFGLERVEVLRGPSSMLFGQGDAGGVINRVSKLPSLDAPREVRLRLGNFDQKQLALDVGGAATDSGSLLYRFVGVGLDTDTQDRYSSSSTVENRRLYIAPSVTWNVTNKTSLTVLGDVLINRTPGFSFSGTPPDYTTNLRFLTGDPSYSKFNQDQYTAGYRFEHRFDSVWTLRQHMRHGQVNVVYHRLDGDDLDADGRTILRSAANFNDRLQQYALDTQLIAKYDFGITEHTTMAGVDWWRADATTQQYQDAAPSLDLLVPFYGQVIPTPTTPVMNIKQNVQQLGFYLQEQMKIDRHWLLTLGLRHDRTSVDSDDRLTATEQTQRNNAFTYRAGLTYLTDFGLAPYVSYTESFLPQIGTDVNGKPFDPTRGKQYEAGMKYRLSSFPALFIVAFYDLTKTNVLTQDPTTPLFSRETGRIRSRGIETEAKASLAEGLDLTLAYTFNDMQVTESNDVDLGKRPVIVPKHMASGWLDYTLQQGLLTGFGGGAGVRYIGSRYNDLENLSIMPSYTLVDAAVHYSRGPWYYALNASNLLNTDYLATCSGGCYRGFERMVIATVRYRW